MGMSPTSVAQMFARGRERRRIAARELRLPLVPSLAALRVFERAVKRVIVQPARGLMSEVLEVGAEAPVRRLLEALEGFSEQRVLELDGFPEINSLFRERRRAREVFRAEQSFADESFGADEQCVAGEGGEALVGRVAEAGRPEREHLPEALAA
jgi:hypothetical protein